MDGYGTHLPALLHAATNSTGDILELGAGDYSTPCLHALGRNIVTVESDPVWLDRYRAMEGVKHELIHLADWRDLVKLDLVHRQWGVVFVDFGGPQWELRGWAALLFRSLARFVVCHDSEAVKYNGYGEAFASFTHKTEYARWSKRTMILSDLGPIPAFESLEIPKN